MIPMNYMEQYEMNQDPAEVLDGEELENVIDRINGRPVGMIRAYDEYGNVVDLVEWEKQIKEKAIDECKKIVMAECTTTCEYPFSPNCVECMSNKMEQLKEQKQ